MSILVTGAAGFVGTNLIRKLLSEGEIVIGVDNFCRGSKNNLIEFLENPNFIFHEIDISDFSKYQKMILKAQSKFPIVEIWHLAANSDIPAGIEDSSIDLRDTFMTTLNTLTLMKEFNVPSIFFASSSAIYGDLGDTPLSENIGPTLPISNYGAMKLASEAAISAASESYLKRACIFRFPNVIGIPATHGVMLDFIKKLIATPLVLNVLGDGTQKKGYLHVDELIDAMLFIKNASKEKVSLFNIGCGDQGITFQDIAEETVRQLSPQANILYGAGNKGWVGDVPRFIYSIEKLKKLGWSPTLNSAQAVKKAISEIIDQEKA